MSDVIGINEERMNSMILDIGDCNDAIMSLFLQMEDVVDRTTQSYQCEAGNAFRNVFSETQTSFNTLQRNLEMYSSDLVRAKDNNAQIDSKALKLAIEAASNIRDISKKQII